MSQLLSKSEETYGSDYRQHYFEQYKLYIEGIEQTSNRRQTANNYFIAINTALLIMLGYSLRHIRHESFDYLIIILGTLCIAGIAVCYIFRSLILSYKQLNAGKFQVLHEIEQHLPLAMYKYEWKLLGEGKEKRSYIPFTKLEPYIPVVFGGLYLLWIVIGLLFWFLQ